MNTGQGLWLDDIRRPPSIGEWMWVRTIEDAKRAVTSHVFTTMSLDHDMGLEDRDPDDYENADVMRVPRKYEHNVCEVIDDEGSINHPREFCRTCQENTDEDEWRLVPEPDGVEFCKWLIFQSAHKIPPTISIHSMNYHGAMNMAHILKDYTHVIVKPFQRY